VGRRAETLEQVHMPGLAGGKGNVVMATDALENVFNAVVKLRQSGATPATLALYYGSSQRTSQFSAAWRSEPPLFCHPILPQIPGSIAQTVEGMR